MNRLLIAVLAALSIVSAHAADYSTKPDDCPKCLVPKGAPPAGDWHLLVMAEQNTCYSPSVTWSSNGAAMTTNATITGNYVVGNVIYGESCGYSREPTQLWGGLTKGECEFMKNRVLGLPATPAEDRVSHEERLKEEENRRIDRVTADAACKGKKDGTDVRFPAAGAGEIGITGEESGSAWCKDGKAAGVHGVDVQFSFTLRHDVTAECFR